MSAAVDLASWLLLLAGGGFSLVGGIGLVRMPEFYCRVHAGGVTDTLGAGLILAGLMLQAGIGLVSVKLAMVGLLLAVTGPTAVHALVKAAYSGGVVVAGGEEEEPAPTP